MRLTQIIEALLFASDAPLSPADVARVDERLDEDTVQAVVDELRGEYDLSERSFQIYEVAGGYQLLTRPEFVSYLERYDTVPRSAKLSPSALEVLAIVAYRQPIGRAEVEEIRGVGSSGVLRTLLDRHLIEAVGRAEGLGRPLLYGTTAKFLEHFGFRSLEDLPKPDELPVVLRESRPAGPAADAPDGAATEAAATEAVAARAEPAAEGPESPQPTAEAEAARGDEAEAGPAPGGEIEAAPEAEAEIGDGFEAEAETAGRARE
jgi:segregation and condensation protein B